MSRERAISGQTYRMPRSGQTYRMPRKPPRPLTISTTGDKRDAVYVPADVPADATGVTKDNRGGSAKGTAARRDLPAGKYLGEPTRAQAAAARRRKAECKSHANRHAGGKGEG